MKSDSNDVRVDLNVQEQSGLETTRNGSYRGGNVSKKSLRSMENSQDKTFDTFLRFMIQVDVVEYWSVPDENMIKVKTNVVLFKTSHYLNYSVVARDHAGGLIFSK